MGDVRDTNRIPGLGRCPGKGNDNWLPYSCLENSKDRGAWHATVHGAAKSQTLQLLEAWKASPENRQERRKPWRKEAEPSRRAYQIEPSDKDHPTRMKKNSIHF